MTKPEANKNYSNSDIMAALYDFKLEMNTQLIIGQQKMDSLQDQITGNKKGVKGIVPAQEDIILRISVLEAVVDRIQSIYIKPLDLAKNNPKITACLIMLSFLVLVTVVKIWPFIKWPTYIKTIISAM